MLHKVMITALVVCAAVAQAAEPPQPDPYFNVHYLDSANGNFLFRGGMPIPTENQFAYGKLLENIRYAADTAKPRVKLPKKFYIADISLVQLQNGGNDTSNLETEYRYWKEHRYEGKFIYWETDGYVVDAACKELFPPSAPAGFRENLVRNVNAWLPDQLVTRVSQLHTWLTTGLTNPLNLPLVLYIHCEGGCDRTGELSGAYAMGYLNKSWRQINEMNHEACGTRPFGCGNFITARWYCLWLAATTGRKDLGCEYPETCSGSPSPGSCPPQSFGTIAQDVVQGSSPKQ